MLVGSVRAGLQAKPFDIEIGCEMVRGKGNYLSRVILIPDRVGCSPSSSRESLDHVRMRRGPIFPR